MRLRSQRCSRYCRYCLEASAEAVNAVAYATKYYPEGFWKGAQHLRKWRTTH